MNVEPRLIRLGSVYNWVITYFGRGVATNTKERAKRLLEEAIELAQCENISLEEVNLLAKHVFAKPIGEPAQEVGGIGVTLLAYCASKRLDPEEEEQREIDRIWLKPVGYFRARHQRKVDAGIAHPMDEE